VGRDRAEDRIRAGLPLPGIWPSLHLDTAITLPVGVETYAAYALRAWLARDQTVSGRTRRFAKWSAICFALGMAGQVAFHLMTQAGMTQAPWPVTPLVSCLPVLVLAMGTALAHMLRAGAEAVDAPDSRTGPRAIRRSPSRSAEDQDGLGRRQPEADRDRSVSRDQTGPKPGPQGGRGIRGPDQRPAEQAHAGIVIREPAAAPAAGTGALADMGPWLELPPCGRRHARHGGHRATHVLMLLW
jgi:hypothetical protein